MDLVDKGKMSSIIYKNGYKNDKRILGNFWHNVKEKTGSKMEKILENECESQKYL